MRDPAEIRDLEDIFKTVFNHAVRFAGLAVFIMLLIGGFKYLTSGDDPEAAKAAKNTLTYAVLGLAFLLGGWLILLFIKEFTGVDVTTFEIPK